MNTYRLFNIDECEEFLALDDEQARLRLLDCEDDYHLERYTLIYDKDFYYKLQNLFQECGDEFYQKKENGEFFFTVDGREVIAHIFIKKYGTQEMIDTWENLINSCKMEWIEVKL
jgi:hypothetical protein